MRNWARPAPATTSPSTIARSSWDKIACINGASSSLYCVMPAAAAMRTTRRRAKPEKSGSSSAERISRTRSARKLKHSTASPSRMPR